MDIASHEVPSREIKDEVGRSLVAAATLIIERVGPSNNMRQLLRSKIHNATVSEANLNYIGSITIDQDLVDRAGLWVGEKVLVVSNTSGAGTSYEIVGDIP